MFADREPAAQHTARVGEDDLVADLGLETLWAAMADGDKVVYGSVRSTLLAPLDDPGEIIYRQAVLADCLAQPTLTRELYGLAEQGLAADREIRRSMFSRRGEALVRRSIAVLEQYVVILRRLREIAEANADDVGSQGFQTFFATLRRELDDDWFEEVAAHLRQLRFDDGVLATARLGAQGQGIEYQLGAPRRGRGLLRLIPPSVPRPSFSYRIPPRDEAGGQQLGALRDRLVTIVADAVGQSTDHITAFFVALRAELGFYVGCVNLHQQLQAKGEPLAVPEPHPAGAVVRHARQLYDPCLSLLVPDRVQGNDLEADGRPLIVVTGANQGGKSTFLRSLGLAQLMMQAGMFVAAEAFAATVVGAVFTHYKREEDPSLTGGKLDEELARMSGVVSAIGDRDLLLSNESFAATNELEGSEIAVEVVRALLDRGSSIAFVTHLYDAAQRLHESDRERTVFLRAERGEGGQRPFALRPGRPLKTSFGEDLFRGTFGSDADADADADAGADAAVADPG